MGFSENFFAKMILKLVKNFESCYLTNILLSPRFELTLLDLYYSESWRHSVLGCIRLAAGVASAVVKGLRRFLFPKKQQNFSLRV